MALLGSMLATLLFVPTAWSWSLASDGSWPLPGEVESLSMASTGVILLGEEALWLADATTGAVADQLSPGGSSLLLEDRNGSGFLDAVFCRHDGLVWVPVSFNLSVSSTITSTPCTRVVSTLLDGQRGYATAGEEVALWSWYGVASESPSFTLDGEPLLASREDGLLAASVGDSAVQELGALGVNSLAAGGLVSWLGATDASWSWTLSDAWLLVDEAGNTTALAAEPGAFLVGEIDGDDWQDVLVLHPATGSVTLVRGLDASTHQLSLGFPPGASSLADLDGDGCEDLLVADEQAGLLHRLLVQGCGDHVDDDGDGYSEDDGDCDDTDPASSPDALESCDGLDNDCDGSVDELELRLVPELELLDTGGATPHDPRFDSGDDSSTMAHEGTAFTVDFVREGCFDEHSLSFEWSESGPLLCEESADWQLACALQDQGPSQLDVTVLHEGTTELASLSMLFAARNQAPRLRGVLRNGCDARRLDTGSTVLYAGNHLHGRLAVNEPGDDTVSFDASSLPEGFVLDEDGDIHFYTSADDVGVFDVEFLLEDEDGGASSSSFSFVVHPAPRGSGSGGGGDGWFPGCDGGGGDNWDWESDDSDGSSYDYCGFLVPPCGCNGGAPGAGVFGLIWILARRRRREGDERRS